MKIIYTVNNLEDTKKIAELLAKHLTKEIILLNGDVGAGKTTLANFFINALCTEYQTVTSPTFTIVQSYDTTVGLIYHLDLYRIENENELQNLGIDEILLETCLVEWSEKLGSYTPKNYIKITISILSENTRELEIEFSKKYEKIYKEIENINVI